MNVRVMDSAAARRFLVRRHLLAPPRALTATADAVLSVVRRFGALQFDPLEVPGARNHELVLHARIRGVARGDCERWLYPAAGERALFEVYNKSLNIVPIEEMAAHRFAWDRARTRHDAGIFASHARVVRDVLDRIQQQGAVTTRAITREHGGAMAWYWAPTAEGRAVLEALFETGQVAVARREGNLRHYDLTERLFPRARLDERMSREGQLRHRLLTRHRAVGLLGQHGATELFVSAGTAHDRARSLRALLDDGTLTPVRVEGMRHTRFVLTGELPLLDDPEPIAPAVSFLAPLDPLVWDRRLLKDLFGFAYLWEVYTPEHKRAHGYYVLPMLFGDRFVGRIEPRMDRARATLTLAGLWLEEGFSVASDGFADAFADALEAYRVFVGARVVVWPRTRLARVLKACWADRRRLELGR